VLTAASQAAPSGSLGGWRALLDREDGRVSALEKFALAVQEVLRCDCRNYVVTAPGAPKGVWSCPDLVDRCVTGSVLTRSFPLVVPGFCNQWSSAVVVDCRRPRSSTR
jgi:hypothetical protein